MKEFTLRHAEALYLRFCAIYGDKFVRPYHTEDFKKMWYEEWVSGLAGIDVGLLKDCLEHCKASLEWVPSIAEFRRFCEKSLGIPTVDEAMQAAIRRDFNHPIVAIAYDKVGSWSMKNDKAQELRIKFLSAYTEALSQFRKDPKPCFAQLEEIKERQISPSLPPKIPTQEECKGFRERLAEYKQMAEDAKKNLTAKDHPVWPKEVITIGSRKFDAIIYNERKKYLLEVDEVLAGTLDSYDWYDRIRFYREAEAMAAIMINTPREGMGEEKKPYHGRKIKPKTVYNRWND